MKAQSELTGDSERAAEMTVPCRWRVSKWINSVETTRALEIKFQKLNNPCRVTKWIESINLASCNMYGQLEEIAREFEKLGTETTRNFTLCEGLTGLASNNVNTNISPEVNQSPCRSAMIGVYSVNSAKVCVFLLKYIITYSYRFFNIL